MTHSLQISRRVDYALRALIYLASAEPGRPVPFKQIAARMRVPEPFLAKILKTLVTKRLLSSTRGTHGGYALGRPARSISFLDVIEALEGPVTLNVCLDDGDGHACALWSDCTMMQVWRAGERKLVEHYRSATLDQVAFPHGAEAARPIAIGGH